MPAAGRPRRSRPPLGEAFCIDEFTPCSVCARSPLVGEVVVVLGEGDREKEVCDLCLSRPRAAALGPPLRRERVHTLQGGETVSRVWPQPVPRPVEAPLAPRSPNSLDVAANSSIAAYTR